VINHTFFVPPSFLKYESMNRELEIILPFGAQSLNLFLAQSNLYCITSWI